MKFKEPVALTPKRSFLEQVEAWSDGVCCSCSVVIQHH